MSFQRGNQEYFRHRKIKTTFQNLCDAASKTVLRGKFIAKQAYLKKQEKFQPTSKRITKECTKPKVSRKKELIKTKSETETKKK